MLTKTSGHISEPWGVILDQAKAIKLIEWLEWGEAIGGHGVAVVPPAPKPLPPKRKRR